MSQNLIIRMSWLLGAFYGRLPTSRDIGESKELRGLSKGTSPLITQGSKGETSNG